MANLDQLQWDDIRFFLALMRTSTLRQAANVLGVTHPTARRRLGTLEQDLGLKLFERRRDGLHATVEAGALLAHAEDVERTVERLKRAAHAAEPALRGPIRASMPHEIATDLLMSALVAFSERFPEIHLELDTSTSLADLERREADVAIRYVAPGGAPDPDLAGRKAVTSYKAVYGDGEQWIGWFGPEEDRAWIAESPFPELPSRGAILDAYVQRQACADGMGLAMLPCFFAEPLLERRTKPRPGRDIWVLVHPDLRRSPRLRTFRDMVVKALKRHRKRLRGTEPDEI